MTYEDVIFQQKLSYLRRVLNIYVKFLKYYSEVDIEVLGNVKNDKFIPRIIEVTYHGSKNEGYPFQRIEFPVEHLGKRIAHYKNKMKRAFLNRHNNPNWR